MSKNKNNLLIPCDGNISRYKLGDKQIITSWIIYRTKYKKISVSVILGNCKEEAKIGYILYSELPLKEAKRLIKENEALIIRFALDWILEVSIAEKLLEFCPEIELLLGKRCRITWAYVFKENEEIKDWLAIDKTFCYDPLVKAEICLRSKDNSSIKETFLVYMLGSIFGNDTIFYPGTSYRTRGRDYIIESVKRLE